MTCIAVLKSSFIQCAPRFFLAKKRAWAGRKQVGLPRVLHHPCHLIARGVAILGVVGVPVNQGRCSLLQGCHENRLRVLPHPEGEVNGFCVVWLKMNVHVCIYLDKYIICMSIYRYRFMYICIYVYHYLHIHCENWGIH